MEQSKRGSFKGYLKGFFYGFGFILLFYVIQFITIFALEIECIFIDVFQEMRAGRDIEQIMADATASILAPEFLTMAMAVSTALTALVFGLWYKLKYAKKFMKNGFVDCKKYILTGRNLLIVSLIGIACYTIELDIAALIGLLCPSTMHEFSEMMNSVTGGSVLLTFLYTVIFAPIGEECIFRGLVEKKLLKWIPVWPAIILQAVLFGIFHLNLVQGIYVLILGIASGYLAYKSKSVLPSIFLHLINNLCAFGVDYLPEAILEIGLLWYIMPLVPVALLVLVWKFMPGEFLAVPETEFMPTDEA